MNEYGANDDAKYMMTHRKVLQQLLKNDGNAPAMDWLIIGMHYAKANEEEIAFQAYEMAHLLDHENIATNSDLKFETMLAQ